ncbi:MAG: nucleotidyl transferase AbiEii/AbiGii toxin family protein [Bacteroidales bacterium]|nr:nucleotidyl transferase AbiEii/AbiGii toxin family protein [Bacteroidales bacterium]
MDTNKHKFFMLQLLKDIFSDALLSSVLAFKGGTATMFFHNLPRFSTDLDFNLLDPAMETEVYEHVRKIVLKYGKIHDEAIKHYGIIIVLDYGIGERKLKIEISNRQYDNHYEIRNYLGLQMRVMIKEDMFAHKLCALLDRSEITARDVFDCWFFLKERTSLNKTIVESRMGMAIDEYLDKCIANVQDISEKSLISGLGELAEGKMKDFVRHGLKEELVSLLTMFKAFPSFA